MENELGAVNLKCHLENVEASLTEEKNENSSDFYTQNDRMYYMLYKLYNIMYHTM